MKTIQEREVFDNYELPDEVDFSHAVRGRILSTETMLSDDDYLRSIDGMVKSIQQARAESLSKGVSLQQLDWLMN